MTFEIRAGRPDDIPSLIEMLEALVASGKRSLPADEAYARPRYIEAGISSRVAVEDGRILGVQALHPGPEDRPGRWGIIGTHVHPLAHGRGIGRALFAATLAAAQDAGIERIEAGIAEANEEGKSAPIRLAAPIPG